MDKVRTHRVVVVVVALGSVGLFVPPVLGSDGGEEAASQITEASYRSILGDSGLNEGILYTHAGDDRGYGPEHDLARANIAAAMESYGLTVTWEPFTYSSTTYYNIVGTMTGVAYPDRVYILGAHFDSVNNPGADDNASGTAGVLDAARVLSQYDSDYTIRFIAFDREEQGLVGSDAYASNHSGDDIRGMVSLDMIAYNSGANSADIYGRSASNGIKTAVAAAVTTYGEGMVSVDQGAYDASDHAPFEWQGFQACLLIEDWGNPYYHTPQDNVDMANYIDYDYGRRMTRIAVGFLVDNAGVDVPVNTLAFDYPNGRPEYCDPPGGTRMRVEVTGVGEMVPESGTGVLHYNVGAGWQSQPMEVVFDDVYDAVFPAADCGTQVLYYVSAQAVSGEEFTHPRDAPAGTFTTLAAYGIATSFSDNFESDLGWTAEILGADSGFWQRGVPVDDPNWDYDPSEDSDGSGRCYLTQNAYGNTDVDDGAVRLTSPVFDMSDGGFIGYDYYLYLTNTAGGVDRLLVEVNNAGGGGAWVEISRHDTNGGLSWRHHEITEADLYAVGVVPTANMRIRYTANDANPQSIVEAGIDAFAVSSLICCLGADADPDEDGDVDLFDFAEFQVCFSGDGNGYPVGIGCEHFDFACDGDVDLDDYAGFVALFD